MSFIDDLDQVTIPKNSGRLLIKQDLNGEEIDSKILFSDLVANLVNSSILGTNVGQVPVLISGTGGSALPVMSGENLTDLDFSGIPIGNASTTGTLRLSDTLSGSNGVNNGIAATPKMVNDLSTSTTNLLAAKGNLATTNTWVDLQTFNENITVLGAGSSYFNGGARIVGSTVIDSLVFSGEGTVEWEDNYSGNGDTLKVGANYLLTHLTLSNSNNIVDSDRAVTNLGWWAIAQQNLGSAAFVDVTSPTATIWDDGNLLPSNSNNSTESSGVFTTPAGVNARIDYQIGEQVEDVYAKLDNGSTQTFSDSIESDGTITALGTGYSYFAGGARIEGSTVIDSLIYSGVGIVDFESNYSGNGDTLKVNASYLLTHLTLSNSNNIVDSDRAVTNLGWWAIAQQNLGSAAFIDETSGTFVPTYGGTVGTFWSLTGESFQARYVRKGNEVTVHFNLDLNYTFSVSLDLRFWMDGLPYNAKTYGGHEAVGTAMTDSGYTILSSNIAYWQVLVDEGTDSFYFHCTHEDGAANMNIPINGSFTYYTEDPF